MRPVQPVVLGIETSCDDTACALLDGDARILASVVSRQLEAHRPYGGVVPEIASREHLGNWSPVSAAALEKSGLGWDDVDVVAATRGPGLVGALLVGLSLGRALAFGLGRPFHAVHHLEGHLYSPFLGPRGEPAQEPPEHFHGLVVSGGHTALYSVADGRISTLAETRDDAMGEVFDKVGKRLGLDYPQGPRVDELAEMAATPGARAFSVATCSDGSLDFSYSGLKSQALLEIEALEASGVDPGLAPGSAAVAEEVLELLEGFRAAAVGQLLDRLRRVHAERPLEILAVSGGVAANRALRRELSSWASAEGVDLRLVALGYASDNAAMIAHAALLRHRRGTSDDLFAAEAASRLALDSTAL